MRRPGLNETIGGVATAVRIPIPPDASGVENLADGTELYLAPLRIVDASLEVQGADHTAFAALKSE
jgi:hypothetical protein